MKNIALFLILTGCFLNFSCKKDSQSEQFKLLTGPVWASDSLLANGADASRPGEMLENFKGDAKFKADGTGYFGIYTGSWRFAFNEKEIVIITDYLPPITTKIVELTKVSLKITTLYYNSINPAAPINVRMTFKAR
jgi:hypothetical protein